MPNASNPPARKPLTPSQAEHRLTEVLSRVGTPWYLILKESRVIRVYHGDLDKSWWCRGSSPGESLVRKIEDEIRNATGLQRVTRKHVREFVDFHLNAALFDRAAVAVRMSYKCLAETDEGIRQILTAHLPPVKAVKPAPRQPTKKRLATE